MTRKQLGTAVNRLSGPTTTEWVLRELRSSMVKTRAARSNPRPLASAPIRSFLETLTGHSATDLMIRRLRLAVAKASRR